MENSDLEKRIWELEEAVDVYEQTVERLINSIINHRLRVMAIDKEGYSGPGQRELDQALWMVPGLIRGGGCGADCLCKAPG